jgi:hypothetical protein
MSEVPSTMRHLSTEFRSDLRFFAFFVGNKSLFASKFWKRYGFEYVPFLLENPVVFGRVFSIFVNVWQPCNVQERATRVAQFDPQYRAEQYLMNQIDPTSDIVPGLETWELTKAETGPMWKQAVNEFSASLGNGSLAPGILGGTHYVADLFGYGSTLEAIFAVFSNVLTIDEQDNPSNKEEAFFRAAQCVKQWCVTGYEAEPGFAGWETELH